jgi:hypothetical protein
MMRKLVLFAWSALPIGGLAYHYGPGQERLVLDDVAAIVASANVSVRDENWGAAVESYDQALKLLPAGHLDVQRRLRLERAKAAMLDSKLPTAASDLAGLVEELQQEKPTGSADPVQADQLLRESREALANAQFYMTWLLRLEGKAREEWEPQIEAARQNFRLLAEDATQRGDAKQQKRSSEDLESAVKLARMEIQDLQGLPLPSQ